ncbi:MAG: (Fe-S)-binding protein [Candidatus Thorarchaeota archaeon]
MSSVWTKARKNTPEIDCGLCGFTTCGAYARSVIIGKAEISVCPILRLYQYNECRENLEVVLSEAKNTERPAPEQPEGGVILSKPCMDAPNLLMAEMRIFNGVTPGEPMKYGVLDPVILCWLLDCISTRYQDMRCSKELAYAWGDMEEIKVHILRDGRVRMRRARGSEHALGSFKIIERTVIGAVICNCCGRDLFTVLMGLAKPSDSTHTVLNAGSTLSINQDMIDWTLKKDEAKTKPISQMLDLIDEIYSDLRMQLDLMISENNLDEDLLDIRQKICKIISLMVESMDEEMDIIFLRGLSLAFFFSNAMSGLKALQEILTEKQSNAEIVTNLLRAARQVSLQNFKDKSMDDNELLIFAHCARVENAINLHYKWMKD